MCVHRHEHTHACVYTGVHTCTYTHKYTCVFKHTCAYTQAHTCVHIPMSTHTRAYTQEYTRVRMHRSTHAYVSTRMHTYVYTYPRAHTCVHRRHTCAPGLCTHSDSQSRVVVRAAFLGGPSRQPGCAVKVPRMEKADAGKVETELLFSSLHLGSQGSGQEGRSLRQWGSQGGPG